MRIDLYLSKLSHEQSEEIDDNFATVGWIHGMTKPDVSANGIVKLMDGAESGPHYPQIAIRSEDWGAVVVHGPTMSVYQVDKPALAMLSRLKNGESLDDLIASPAPFTVAEVEVFRREVERLGLLR